MVNRKKIKYSCKTLTAIICISAAMLLTNTVYAREYMDTENVEYIIVDDMENANDSDNNTENNVRISNESNNVSNTENGNYNKETAGISVYEATSEISTQADNITLPTGVTRQMCNADFWSVLVKNATDVMMTKKEISELNKQIVATKESNMYDLENMKPEYDGNALKSTLASETVPERKLYIKGALLQDNQAYFNAIKENITGAATTTQDTVKYAVAVKYANMKAWPTTDIIGYSADDTDDEIQTSSLRVNEPFVVKAVTADGRFCWGYTTNCSGWVETASLAFCSSKEEWLDAWKVDIEGDEFLVVTTNKIVLEDSMYNTATANVMLTLGTTLKLVPKADIPESIVDRGTWNNYVVYLPTRDNNGNYVKKYALISMHYNVSTGYLELTQENVMKVAFECLGDRYGWGGMLNAMDCSAYTRTVYKCFGFELARNTTWQQAVPGHTIDISGMTDEQKMEVFKAVPIGSLMYMRGHTVVYTGIYDDSAYAISATGSLRDTKEGSAYISQQNVILNPLTVRRSNETTWLSNMTKIVYFGDITEKDINDCKIDISDDDIAYTGAELKPEIVITSGKYTLKADEDYTLSYSNNTDAGEAIVTITGMGLFKGSAEKTFVIKKASYEIETKDYSGKYDGNAHSITLTGVYEGSKIEYRIGETGDWIEQKPARIKEGITTVYYRITHPNYETIEGKNTITITKANNSGTSDKPETPSDNESGNRPGDNQNVKPGEKPGAASSDVKDNATGTITSDTTTDAASASQSGKAAQTGDSTVYMYIYVIMLLSCVIAVGVMKYKKKVR